MLHTNRYVFNKRLDKKNKFLNSFEYIFCLCLCAFVIECGLMVCI